MILFYFNGLLPVNIDNLLLFLEGTTKFGIGLSTALFYMVSIVSSLIFGYYCDKISEKISLSSKNILSFMSVPYIQTLIKKHSKNLIDLFGNLYKIYEKSYTSHSLHLTDFCSHCNVHTLTLLL